MTDPEQAAARRSYRPGDWFGIFGDQVVVVLPPTEKQRVAAVWSLVDEGAGFDEVLDALIADGLRDLTGFVLVSQTGDDTKVVIRGAARAELTTVTDTNTETATVAGSGATTWAERSLTGVTALRIEVADAEDADDLEIRGGLVRISRADAPSVATAQGLESAADDVGRLAPAGPTPTPTGAALDAPAAPPGDPAAEVPPAARADVPADVSADLPAPGPLPGPGPDEPAVAAPDGPTGDGPALEVTDILPAAPVSPTEEAGWAQPRVLPPMPSMPSMPPAAPEPDGPTHAGNWSPGPREAVPAPTPPVPPQAVARLVFSSGEVIDVDRPVIIGRAPSASRFGSGEQPRLVTVPSPHQEISSTHLEIRPGAGADQGSAVATDLGSTNGTVLMQPGLPPEDLKPGIAAQLVPGAVVDLGDGVTIQVGRP